MGVLSGKGCKLTGAHGGDGALGLSAGHCHECRESRKRPTELAGEGCCKCLLPTREDLNDKEGKGGREAGGRVGVMACLGACVSSPPSA